jgi:hypothetical protein
MKVMKKVLKKPENKKCKGKKFMNKYKYLGLNLQNTLILILSRSN